ncbi:hypothetical protein MTO96_042001 [Rhipicephalus appendiculatus]
MQQPSERAVETPTPAAPAVEPTPTTSSNANRAAKRRAAEDPPDVPVTMSNLMEALARLRTDIAADRAADMTPHTLQLTELRARLQILEGQHAAFTIDRLIHKLKVSGKTDTQITDELAARYLCTEPSSPSDYPPAPDATEEDPLESPFTCAEVKVVLSELNCRSAPGPDGIKNKLLKNFAEEDIELLTEYINKIWETVVDGERRRAFLGNCEYTRDGYCGLPTDPATTNLSSQQREADTPTGDRMEEDTAIYGNKTDDDAGGCWKTVIHK